MISWNFVVVKLKTKFFKQWINIKPNVLQIRLNYLNNSGYFDFNMGARKFMLKTSGKHHLLYQMLSINNFSMFAIFILIIKYPISLAPYKNYGPKNVNAINF